MRLNLKYVFFAAAFVLAPLASGAQELWSRSTPRQKNLSFEWNTDYSYYFDNREFDVSKNKYSYSETVNAALVTPSVGFVLKENSDVVHRLRFGLDVIKEMGAGKENLELARELTMFYDVHARMGGAAFEGVAGCFPRSYMEGEYGPAFIDDKIAFLDRNLEGVLLKYKNENFFAEAGCDWMGMKGETVHERFQVFTALAWDILPCLRLGFAGSMYHYACSKASPGVVDNHMVNPYLKFDLSGWSSLDELSFKAGGILTYQRDRVRDEEPFMPGGGEFVLSVREWGLGLENRLFVGDDLQVYRDKVDLAGEVYGSDLYFGSPMYRSDPYDRAEVFWQPELGKCLTLRLSCVFHFGSGFEGRNYLGSQQMLSLRFNLDPRKSPSAVPGKVGMPMTRRTISIKDFLHL